uniref:Sushi domain-containing protein n=1 Tax=Sphenodon punctatus TaxID=8508 RepID=A0A8D0H9X2_SPHPU
MQCPVPPDISNGKHSSQDSSIFISGTSVRYSCEPGFTLIGEAMISCTESGSWSSSVPHCKVDGCITPEIQSGRITGFKEVSSPKESITIDCDRGYILKGSTEIKCQSDGTWYPLAPVCERGR